MKKILTPTGMIIVDKYDKGELETLSIADYGKARNIKAQFLGFNNDINGVANGNVMPLSEKWVITLSTQYGCVQKCTFCDVPNVKFRGNATLDDLYNQFKNAISVYPDIKYTDRLNIHFARMGEPIFNENVLEFARMLHNKKMEIQNRTGVRFETIHPVLTTSMPNYKHVESRLLEWCDIKNNLYNGQAGLQISLNSTDNVQRDRLFGFSSMSIEEIADICSRLPPPLSRKYCLNFPISDETIIDPQRLVELFNPEHFMVKITPIHKTTTSELNGIKTTDGYTDFYPYKVHEEALIKVGFDVLIFIPSQEEEDSTITCGNAILGGSEIKVVVE